MLLNLYCPRICGRHFVYSAVWPQQRLSHGSQLLACGNQVLVALYTVLGTPGISYMMLVFMPDCKR